MKHSFLAVLTAVLSLVAGLQPARLAAADEETSVAREARGILADKCFACHGPDENARKAHLRLDVQDEALRERKGRIPVVPGDPARSELYRRVSSQDPDERMPPAEAKKPLTEKEIATLRDWIQGGARWEQHWAFITPVRPPLPAVSHANWARGQVDLFVLRRLEAVGLAPASDADRISLARRVSFDLTGLPPSLDEAEAFAADESPDAFERFVDRLLASPAFGEHFGRLWLDLARYGDTHGLHLDNLRLMWPYRDWVVAAFNENLPFDRFTVEQLAGDLLPDATLAQQIASGFNRCHVTTSEGGSIEEEVYVRNVIDRTSTMASVFMGLTAGCAVCHDHKYDPIKSKDFYSLFAYFNSLDGSPLDGNNAAYPPVVKVPMLEQSEELDRLAQTLDGLERERRQQLASFRYEEPASPAPTPAPEPREVVWIDDDVPAGANAQGGWMWVESPVLSGKRASRRSAEGLSQHLFQDAKEPLVMAEGDTLFAHVHIDPANPPQEIMLQWHDGSWEHRAYWGENKIDWGQADSPSRRAMGPLPRVGEWVRLDVSAAQVGLGPGARVQGWAFTQFGGTVYWDKAGVVTASDPDPAFESLRAWIAYQRTRKSSSIPKPLLAAIEKDEAQRTAEENRALQEHFLERVYTGSRHIFDPLNERLAAARQRRQAIENELATTLVFKEREKPREAYVLKRGQYDQRAEQVERRTPLFLPAMRGDLPPNRLGLARWLVDPAHPLTARVAANRLWQWIFGVGLVRTAEDFGSQGERPSHPFLLDWLAVDYRDTGWDTKRFVKSLVLSSTYRQSAAIAPEALAKDPENRLYSRGRRYRLDAEEIRDQALFLGGLLTRAMGGPSVKPPQPPGLWEAVGYTSSNTARFAADSGEKIYRRSLYTFWKRTSPPPQMTTLDAPSREACTTRRERTNTPLQALLLLNEVEFVEAARRFAERSMREAGESREARASFLLKNACLRSPEPEELEALLALHQSELTRFQAGPADATALVSEGTIAPDPRLDKPELAAWTLVANLVLNLDEVLSKQ